MSYTPTKPFAYALHVARKAIAASAKFQELVGAANETAALAFVHIFEGEGQAAATRAIVDWENPEKEIVASGTWLDRGRIAVTLELLVDEDYTTRPDSALWVSDVAETIADEMAAAGIAGGAYLCWRRMTGLQIGPAQAINGNEVFEENLWIATFLLEFP